MNWTIGKRITAGLVFQITLLAVVLGVAAAEFQRTKAEYDSALSHTRNEQAAALDADVSFLRAAVELQGMAFPASNADRQVLDSLITDARTDFRGMASAGSDAEQTHLWQQISASMETWVGSARQALSAADAGSVEEANRIRDEQNVAIREELRARIREALALAGDRADAAEAEAMDASRASYQALLGGGLLALVLMLATGVLLARGVNRPLRETGSLLASTATELLSATVEQSAGADESSTSVTETVTTVDEVAQTAEQASDRARAVAESSQRATEIAQRGREVVDDSIAALTEVRVQVEAVAGSILSLAEQAQDIGTIIASVNDIAEQTNILALNASVEAARAGEQGRGFAVVATEIRDLADESKAATVQVRNILGQIQRATGSTVMNAEQGTKRVSALSDKMEEAGSTIRTLADAVAEASEMGIQIAASAGQQSAGMSQIREAMVNVREAARQNVAATRQTEAAARNLQFQGQRLVMLVGGGNGRHPAPEEA